MYFSNQLHEIRPMAAANTGQQAQVTNLRGHGGHRCACTETASARACLCLSADAVQVLFRQGGVREPIFKCEHSSFLLFPTGYHTDKTMLTGQATAYHETAGWDPKHANVIPLKAFCQVRDVCELVRALDRAQASTQQVIIIVTLSAVTMCKTSRTS